MRRAGDRHQCKQPRRAKGKNRGRRLARHMLHPEQNFDDRKECAK